MTAVDRDHLSHRLEEFFQRTLSFAHAEGLDQLVEMDCSMSQARVLFAAAQAGEPTPIGTLAERVGLTLVTAGRAVDAMVKAGALERQENPEDRRVKLVALTDRGFSIVDAQFAHKRAALRTLADRLQPTDADDLHRVLGTILAGDALRPNDTKDTP